MSISPDPFKAIHEFCVLTAKTEELREVMQVFDLHFKRIRSRFTDQIYAVPHDAHGCTVSVTTCAAMGHMSAAVRTAQVVTTKQPSFMMFVGTAASLRPEEIQAGDVVIPRKAVNRFYDKVSEKGQTDYEDRARRADFKETFFQDNALISDISSIDCSADALGAVASIHFDRIKLEDVGSDTIEVAGSRILLRKPKVVDDVDIFSCGMVVDSLSYRQFLIELAEVTMRKVRVIDMESYGFFKAIQDVRQTGVGTACEGVMIRGISDYAGRKQQTEAKPMAWKGSR